MHDVCYLCSPSSGVMLLYNRKKARYRKDGYCWKKRRDGKTTREDHMKLKVQGIECIYGCYVHSAILPTFHRRCYWLLQVALLLLHTHYTHYYYTHYYYTHYYYTHTLLLHTLLLLLHTLLLGPHEAEGSRHRVHLRLLCTLGHTADVSPTMLLAPTGHTTTTHTHYYYTHYYYTHYYH